MRLMWSGWRTLCRQDDNSEDLEQWVMVADNYERCNHYFQQCDLWERVGQPSERDRMPHQPVLPLNPFQKWGLNFVGPFKLVAARTGNRYVTVATYYFIKWVKAKVLQDNMITSTTKFLYECIWCRCGCPIKIVISKFQKKKIHKKANKESFVCDKFSNIK